MQCYMNSIACRFAMLILSAHAMGDSQTGKYGSFNKVSQLFDRDTNACPLKFTMDNVCDSLTVKNDEDTLIFDIFLTGFPRIDTLNGPDELAEQRRRSDSLFSTFYIRYAFRPQERLGSPTDSLLNWYYPWLYVTKKTALEIAAIPFVSELQYIPRIPVSVERKISRKTAISKNFNRVFDISGKRTHPRKYFSGITFGSP